VKIAGEFAGKAGFAKVDGDDSPELVQKYNVEGYPTTIVFKGGKEVGRVLGAMDSEIKDELIQALN
jgi:thioredoxin-like negative regulator of GroEL